MTKRHLLEWLYTDWEEVARKAKEHQEYKVSRRKILKRLYAQNIKLGMKKSIEKERILYALNTIDSVKNKIKRSQSQSH